MYANVDPFSLEVFLAVCDEGSFARAAGTLFLSEPAVSIRMRKLEQRLGLTLFERNRRGVRLTHPGNILRDGIRQTLAQLDAAILEAQAAERGITTRVLMWLPPIMSLLLPAVLTEFEKARSYVHLVCRSENPDTVLATLSNRDVDCAVIASHEDPRLNGYQATPLVRDSLGLLLAPDHPLVAHAVLMPDDLQPLRLIAYSDTGLPYWERVKRAFTGSPLRFADALPVGSLEGVKEVVKHGLGVAFMPQLAVLAEVERGDLVFRPIESSSGEPLEVTLWFCFSNRHVLHDELADLRDILVAAGNRLQARLQTVSRTDTRRVVRRP